MAERRPYNRYQYDTNPKKLQPEYDKPRKKVQPKKTSTVKKVNTISSKTVKGKKKNNKVKIITYLVIGFTILFAIGYRNSQINESFVKLQGLKTELATVQKENEQLRVNIENGLNLKTIEESARDQLGMQKLDSKQKIYVNLPKRDYVEPATEKTTEEQSLIQRIINQFKNIL